MRATTYPDESKRDVARTWHYRGAEFCVADYLRHRYALHFHEQYSIGLVLRGALQFRRGATQHTARCGEVSLINPGEAHSGHAAGGDGWTIRNVLIAPEIVTACREEITHGDAITFECPVNADRRIFDALFRLHRTTELSACEIARESALIGAVTTLVRLSARKNETRKLGSHRAGIRRACDLMRDRFAAPLTLDELADASHVSKHHFLRLFNADIGMTPHAYLVQLRLRAAARLMKSGVCIAEAAIASGFADQSHFTRSFKRTWGVTPRAYARASISASIFQ
ncbi:MAG: AraC family transcriptional regulator [Rudaea sp.]